MPVPVLTNEGFEGRRIIIGDYFHAGEVLSAGDVVGIQQGRQSRNLPRLFKMKDGVDLRRVIGIVHTGSDESLGDRSVGKDDPVPLVVRGLAQAGADGKLSIGDPVTPAMKTDTFSGHPLALVKKATSADEPIVGRSLSNTGTAGGEITVLVDVSGTGDAPPLHEIEWLGVLNAGDRMVEEGSYEADLLSVNRPGMYARYYAFSLTYPTRVRINLEAGHSSDSSSMDDEEEDLRSPSSVNTFLYMMEGRGKSGTQVASNDDVGAGTDSQLLVNLQPGMYTVEATTFEQETGDFTLTLTGLSPDPSNLTLKPRRAAGTAVVDFDTPPNAPSGSAYRVIFWETNRDQDDDTQEEETIAVPPGVVYGLDPCVPYTFSVATRSHVSWRTDPLYSGVVTGEFTARLHAPLYFRAFPAKIARQLQLAWTHAEDHDPARHHYEVQARKIEWDAVAEEMDEVPWWPVESWVVTSNGLIINGLEPGAPRVSSCGGLSR